MNCATVTAIPAKGPVRRNTLSEAVAATTESVALSCPISGASRGFSTGLLDGFGLGGSVRKAGRVTSDAFLTPSPPLSRRNGGGGFLSPEGVEAMQSQSPATSTTGTTAVSTITRRSKPAVVRITKPSGLSFHARHIGARGYAIQENAFDVPLEDYDHGWDTGRRAAAELLAAIKAAPRDGMPMFGWRLSDLLPDVEKAMAERKTGDTPGRRGAALGFLSVLDAAIQFAADNADMQAYVQRELDRAEVQRLQRSKREAAERVEFVARMQAARKAKRAARAVVVGMRGIGMDMIPPFAVWADGVLVATHDTEEQAEDCYARLRQQRADVKKAVAA